MALDPTCTVQDGGGAPQSTVNGADVTAANTVTVQLANVAGVGVFSLGIVGQDDTVTPPALTMDAPNKRVTFTAPAGPWALLFECKVGVSSLGKDANGQTQPSYTKRFIVTCKTANGDRLFATNEQGENNASFGWAPKLNKFIKSMGAMAGDVTGPIGSNTVVQLTGSAGVVTLANGTKISSAIASVGDMVTPSAGILQVGQLSTAMSVWVLGFNGALVKSNGDAVVQSVSGGVYAYGGNIVFGSGAGTEFARFVAADPSLRFDSGSGTFPAAGLLRTKSYSSAGGTALWQGRNAAGDADILRQGISSASTVMVLFDNNATSGWTVQFNPYNGSQNSRATWTYFMVAANSWQWSEFNSGAANVRFGIVTTGGAFTMEFGATITPTVKQADQTTNSTNGVNTTYQAQNATGTTSDGGSNVFQGGTGTSVYGKAAVFTGAVDFGAGDVSFPNSAVTLTAAQSTLTFYRLTAGGIAGNQNLTITRRAAAPGQVCIFNNTGFQITVFWLTGTGIAVANGATVWVGSDGTNAIKRG